MLTFVRTSGPTVCDGITQNKQGYPILVEVTSKKKKRKVRGQQKLKEKRKSIQRKERKRHD